MLKSSQLGRVESLLHERACIVMMASCIKHGIAKDPYTGEGRIEAAQIFAPYSKTEGFIIRDDEHPGLIDGIRTAMHARKTAIEAELYKLGVQVDDDHHQARGNRE